MYRAEYWKCFLVILGIACKWWKSCFAQGLLHFCLTCCCTGSMHHSCCLCLSSPWCLHPESCIIHPSRLPWTISLSLLHFLSQFIYACICSDVRFTPCLLGNVRERPLKFRFYECPFSSFSNLVYLTALYFLNLPAFLLCCSKIGFCTGFCSPCTLTVKWV